LEDRRNVGESSCNFGDRTDQRVQFLMFMMMMKTESGGVRKETSPIPDDSSYLTENTVYVHYEDS